MMLDGKFSIYFSSGVEALVHLRIIYNAHFNAHIVVVWFVVIMYDVCLLLG